MSTSTSPANPHLQEERDLARLCSKRLAVLLQGTISTPFLAIVAGASTPEAILPRQFDLLDAFALVLSNLTGSVVPTDNAHAARETADRLHAGIRRLEVSLRTVEPQKPEGLEQRFAIAKQDTMAVCSELLWYCHLLEVDQSPIVKVQEVCLTIFDCLLKDVIRSSKAARNTNGVAAAAEALVASP